jgi:ATP-dependent helicase/DNAse subunit B
LKTDRLLDRYRAVLLTHPPGTALWLAPTSRAATAIRSRLLGHGLEGCFAPGITTFAGFAESILQRSPQTVRRLSGLAARQLVRQLVDDEFQRGGLKHFGPIAATAGLLDLLCDFIRQMKRLEIWPEQFAAACEQRGFTAKDRELLAIYRAYQQNLVDHDLYDAEGRLWSARDLLHRQPNSYRFVVADGFSDFTRTEHDILVDLAARAEEVWITLPLEQENARPDLFQKPRKTFDELRRRHENLKIEAMERGTRPHPIAESPHPDHGYMVPALSRVRERGAWTAMDCLERNLFANPRTVRPASDTVGLEILAAGRQIGELELIGRRIKRLLLEGDGARPVRPGEIAVVFRNPQAAADLVREVFQQLEIPIYIECGHSLARSPALVMLVRLLELDAEDWPMHKLLGVLGSNYFAPRYDKALVGRMPHGLVERTIRGLQIPRGRERLLERVGSDGHDFNRNSPEGVPITPNATEDVPYRVLRGLADAFDRLPRHDTLAAYAQAWEELADQTGLLAAMSSEDQAAWNQLQQTLGENGRLAAWIGREPPRLDRKQAYQALLDILASQTLSLSNDETGRVRVLSAASARHLQIPYLFLAGLAEKVFPTADREDSIYSAAEHQRLIEAGLPLPSRSDRQTDEMLLFYETVTAATRRLWFSYPAINDSGEPLASSPYLKEVEQALGETPIARSEQIDLRPVPGASDLMSRDAFRIRAVFDAVEGNPGLLAGYVEHWSINDPPSPPAPLPRTGEGRHSPPSPRPWVHGARPLPNTGGGRKAEQIPHLSSLIPHPSSLLAGLEFSLARQNRDRFGPTEGMLSPAVAESLAADFPRERIFSATELERYAYCPYQFFLEKVLHVEPLDEIELEVDYRERGQMAHALLAAFHRRVNLFRGADESPAALAAADYERLLAEAVAETLVPAGRDGLAEALREIDRRNLLAWLTNYREQHEKYDAEWEECEQPPRPAAFEVSFGRDLREGDGEHSTAAPLELTSGGETIRLAGRIDRIDVGQAAGRTIVNIVDYKTSQRTRFTLEDCLRGTALQLPLYALAATELVLGDRDALPWQGGYWYINGSGFKPQAALKMHGLVDGRLGAIGMWETIRGSLADLVVGLVRSIRQGQFPVWSDDAQCTSFCPYRTVCRINHIRSLEKTWRPQVTP